MFLAWSPLDRDKAIWHLIRGGETCRGCGTHPDAWDPDKGGHRAAYLAEVHLCPGCEQRQRVEARLSSPENKGQRGLSVIMRPNPEVRHRGR